MFKFSKHLCPSFLLGPAEVPERETEAESNAPTRISFNPVSYLWTLTSFSLSCSELSSSSVGNRGGCFKAPPPQSPAFLLRHGELPKA